MKLSAASGQLEVNGETTEHDVGIGDPWLLIEYLTNTVYGDKPGVIVQEIASNSRDAHREMGQPRPIQIKLPNRLDPTITFRDFGPGMDPERIQKVYLRYGNSTKRGGNEQTGGFGIGGKTPWCYTDAFTVTTTAREKGKLVRREYSMVKGADRKLQCIEMGRAVEIDETDTSIPKDERCTGTKVSIDVKKDDFDTFKAKVVRACKWWKAGERPVITGGEIHFPDFSKRMGEGPGWALLMDRDPLIYGSEPTVVLDGIPYPLSANSLGISNELHSMMDARLVLFFNVGELSLALSREALQYDEPTKAALLKRIEEAKDALTQQVSDKLKNCATLKEAVILYHEMQRSFTISNFVKKAQWNGINCNFETIGVGVGGTARNYTKETIRGVERIKSKATNSLHISTNHLWVLNDTGERSTLRIYTLFNTYPSMSTITVVEPGNLWDEYSTSHHLDKFDFVKMSTVEKFKRPKNDPASAANAGFSPRAATKAYLFTGETGSARKMWDAHDIDMDDGEGVYVTIERGTVCDFNHHTIAKAVSLVALDELIGVPERFVQHLGPGWIKFQDHFAEELEKLESSIDKEAVARHLLVKDLALSKVCNGYAASTILMSDFHLMIEDQTCPLMHWMSRSRDIEAENNTFMLSWHRLSKMYECVNKVIQLPEVEDELTEIVAACKSSYPLFMRIAADYDNFYNSGFDKIKSDLALYVNAKNMELTNKAVAV